MTSRAVYRLYDRDGRLLYVGSSANPDRRLAVHCHLRHQQAPWGRYVTSMTVDWFFDAARAYAEEQLAHHHEQPVFYRPRGNNRQMTELRRSGKEREAQYCGAHEPITWNHARRVRHLGPAGVRVTQLTTPTRCSTCATWENTPTGHGQ